MKRFLSPLSACLAGCAFLSVSVLLLAVHVRALRDTRTSALPIAAQLPPLEHRLQILSQQVELSQLSAQLRLGSPEEKLHLYVLPPPHDTVRLLAFFDVLRDSLSRQKLLKTMAPITLGEPVNADGSGALRSRSFSLDVAVRDDGRKTALGLMDLSGLLTVGDALTSEQLQHLFSLTESQNYAGIVPLEKFLSADLYGYARQPQAFEQQLLQSFPSEQFLRDFRGIVDASRLQEARHILGGPLGAILQQQKLWPLPFMQIMSVQEDDQADGWEHLVAGVEAYARGK